MLSKDQIRVLLLLPSAQNDDDSPIVCELYVASRSDNPSNEALSYAWDDHAPFTIRVSGNEVKVTLDLFKQMRQQKGGWCRTRWWGFLDIFEVGRNVIVRNI